MFKKNFVLKHTWNFRDLEPDSHLSLKETHFGASWTIEMFFDDEDYAIELWCSGKEKRDWEVEATFEFFSVLPSGERKSMGGPQQEKFGSRGRSFGPEDFTEEEIFTNHVDDNHMLNLECHVTIDSMSGFVEKRKHYENPKKHLTDVALKVGDQEFHVCKGLMASFSPYFEALFFGNFEETGQGVVELKEVNPDDFQQLLDAIYTQTKVDVSNVEVLLKLADRFDVFAVRERCKDFLMTSTDRRMKMRLADRYDMEEVKKVCLDAMKTIGDLDDFVGVDVSELSPSTTTAVLKKSIELAKKNSSR